MAKIFISAGHHADSRGATGNGIQEYIINLDVAKELESLFLKNRCAVLMARTTHEAITLHERTNMANQWGADILIDIHHNAHHLQTTRGIETFYSVRTPESKMLAGFVHDELTLQFPEMPNRGIKEKRGTGGRDFFHMLRESRAKAAIITECGFVTSPRDASIMKKNGFAKEQAEAIFDGVMNYLELLSPPSVDEIGDLKKENMELKNTLRKIISLAEERLQ